MKNVLVLNTKMVERNRRLEGALKEYAAEFRAEDTTAEYQMEVAIDVLRAAKINYIGGIVVPRIDSIEVLHGEDKDNYLLGQLIGSIREARVEAKYNAEIAEAVEDFKAKEIGLVAQAKAGDELAVRSINGLADMAAIIADMKMGAVINWRTKGAKGSQIARLAGTGRRSLIEYKLVTRDEEGNMVFCKSMDEVKVVKEAVKKVAKKQGATKVYVYGDAGFKAPKGTETAKRVDKSAEQLKAEKEAAKKIVESVKVAREAVIDVERESVSVRFNLQLLASGSASTSTNNTNNTNVEGEKEQMKNNLTTQDRVNLFTQQIAKGLNITEAQVKSFINEDTVIASSKKEVFSVLDGKLYGASNQAVVKEVKIINDLELADDSKLKGQGCTVGNKLIQQGEFHRSSGIKPHSKKRTITITLENGSTREIIAGGDSPIKVFDSLAVVNLKDQPNLRAEKTFGFYLHKPSTSTKEHVYLIRKEAGNTTLIRDGLEIVTDAKEYDEVINCQRHYVPMQSTNSGKKKTEAIYVNAKIYDENQRTDLVDNAMGGAFRYALNKTVVKAGRPDGSVTIADVAKLDARVTLQNTPSVRLGQIAGGNPGSVLYIDAPRKTIKALLKEATGLNSEDMHIENTDKTTDGQAEYSAESFAYNILVNYNILVSPKALVGADFQGRNSLYNAKVFFAVRAKKNLVKTAMRMIKLCRERGLKFCIQSNNGSTVDANSLNDKEISELFKDLCMILDGDGAKLVNFDGIANNNAFNLVYLAQAKPNATSISNQMLSGIYGAELIEEYLGTEKRSVNTIAKVSNVVSELAYENTVKAIDNLTTRGFNIKGNASNPFFAVNPDLAITDKFLLNEALTDVSKNVIASVRKGKTAVNGNTLYCMFDNSFWITAGKVRNLLEVRSDIHAIEIYNKVLFSTLPEEAQAKITEIELNYTVEEARPMIDELFLASGTKYPAISMFESLLCRPLTERELKHRAEEVKEQAKQEIKDKKELDEVLSSIGDALEFILERGEGTVVLAPEDMVKEVWAGMDTDFDSLAVFTEKRLVDLLKDHKNNIDMMAIGTYIGERDAVCDMTTELLPNTQNGLSSQGTGLDKIFNNVSLLDTLLNK